VAYYFSIAYISEKAVDQLYLNTIHELPAQPTSFRSGTYAVQIIVYSANGEWAGQWYELIFRGANGSFNGDQLTVRELTENPVSSL
jgi:hypothetical protein